MKNRAIRIGLALVCAGVVLQAQTGGFGGPSILSRGGGGMGTSRGRGLGLSAYGSVQGTYTWGFSPLRSSADGSALTRTRIGDLSGGGVMLDGGLVGYYQKQRQATSFAVRSLYSNNSQGNTFNNYGVNMEFAHNRQINRKTTFFISIAGAKTNFTGQFLYRFTEEPVAQTVNPGFEIFDSRLTTVTGAAGITYQKSLKWSFSAQGSAFGADRRENSLIDTRGAVGSGTAQYTVSRRMWVGASYGYQWYFFPGKFGETRAHAPNIFIRRQFTRRWSGDLTAGIFSAFSERVATVPVDPLIAELTGQLTGLQIFRKTNVGWTGGLGLTGTFRESSISFNYGRSLQAGNGVYLTSASDIGTVNYTRQVRGGFALNFFGSYSRLAALTQTIGRGEYKTVGGSASKQITPYLNVIGSAGYFNTNVFNGRFARDRVYVSAGIQLSPQDLPLLR